MHQLWFHPKGEGVLKGLGIGEVDDAWKSELPGEVINDRGDRQVLRLHPPGQEHPVYLKRWRFSSGSPFRCLPGKADLRNRARKERDNLETLRGGGIVVPLPLAFGEGSGMFGPTSSFLLLEDLTGYRACSERLQASVENSPMMIQGVTETLARLHEMGLYARSPGLKHFYVTEDLSSFGMIDVPRLDRDPRGWFRTIKQVTGGDVPSRERDLSKVLVEWQSLFPEREPWQEYFWSGYARQSKDLAEDPQWRSRILSLAEKRRKARSVRT